MLELIKKLQQSTEPSRELDLEIYVAAYPDSELTKTIRVHRRGLDHKEGMAWDIWQGSVVFEKFTADGRCPYNGGYPLPAFTSSVDASLTLMRSHYLWELKQGIGCRAIVWWIAHDWDDTGAPTAYGTTHPALALTIAALIARAVEDKLPLTSCK